MRGVDDSAKRLTGDVHLLCGLFLIHSFKVCQADCLKLIKAEVNLLQDGQRNSARFVIVALR
jgi:hypothetical protein